MPRVLHFSAVHSHCSYTPCLKPKPAPIRGVHNVVNEHQLLGFLNTSYSTYYMTSPEAQCRGCISSLVYNIKCYKGSTVTTNSMSATKAKWSLHAWLPTRHTYTTYPMLLDYTAIWTQDLLALPDPRPRGRRKVA